MLSDKVKSFLPMIVGIVAILLIAGLIWWASKSLNVSQSLQSSFKSSKSTPGSSKSSGSTAANTQAQAGSGAGAQAGD